MSAIIKFHMQQGALISFPAPLTEYGTCKFKHGLDEGKTPHDFEAIYSHSFSSHSSSRYQHRKQASKTALTYVSVYLSSPSSQVCSVLFSCITAAGQHVHDQAFGQFPRLLETAHVEDRLAAHCRHAAATDGVPILPRPVGLQHDLAGRPNLVAHCHQRPAVCHDGLSVGFGV